ncbi:hypothetical protein TNCV_2209951 [Trichonephila clavipes]|nr:hypothetical protein TNCV_2209951 [Trichonephila clavipes]
MNSSGSGVHILSPAGVMHIKIKNPNFCSALRSELIAMQFACETDVQFQDVCILTNCRASVQHLSNWTSIGDLPSYDIVTNFMSNSGNNLYLWMCNAFNLL